MSRKSKLATLSLSISLLLPGSVAFAAPSANVVASPSLSSEVVSMPTARKGCYRYTRFNVILRKGKGTNTAKLLTIPKGACVTQENMSTINTKGELWTPVAYKGKHGYVRSDLLGCSLSPSYWCLED